MKSRSATLASELVRQILMRRSLPSRDQLLLRIGAAKTEAGRAFSFVKIQLPHMDQAVTRDSFRFQLDKDRLKQAEHRDGYYLLRSNLTVEDPAVIWTLYVQLTQIEGVFRSLNSELGIRPIYHQKGDRIDAHIFIAFLAYCQQVTLKNRAMAYAPGLTRLAILEKTQRHPDDRRLLSRLRRPLAHFAALHSTGRRPQASFASPPPGTSIATATTHHGDGTARRIRSIPFRWVLW